MKENLKNALECFGQMMLVFTLLPLAVTLFGGWMWLVLSAVIGAWQWMGGVMPWECG